MSDRPGPHLVDGLSPTDARQQEQLNALQAMADRNARTDFWQWIAILGAAVVLLGYLNLVWLGVMRGQADTIRDIIRQCGPRGDLRDIVPLEIRK